MKRKDRATAAPLNAHALLCNIIRAIHLLKEATGLAKVFSSSVDTPTTPAAPHCPTPPSGRLPTRPGDTGLHTDSMPTSTGSPSPCGREFVEAELYPGFLFPWREPSPARARVDSDGRRLFHPLQILTPCKFLKTP